MKKHIFVILMLIIVGCATYIDPLCRHEVVYAALTYNDLTGKKVRIVIYPLDQETMHAEAQSKEPDGWHWLIHDRGRIRLGKKIKEEPPKTYTIQEFMEDQF